MLFPYKIVLIFLGKYHYFVQILIPNFLFCEVMSRDIRLTSELDETTFFETDTRPRLGLVKISRPRLRPRTSLFKISRPRLRPRTSLFKISRPRRDREFYKMIFWDRDETEMRDSDPFLDFSRPRPDFFSSIWRLQYLQIHYSIIRYRDIKSEINI